MKNYIIKLFIFCNIIASIIGCTKETSFLDAKPQKSLSTISTLNDCQLLLSNESIFNQFTTPGFFTGYADEYYVTQESFNDGEDSKKNIYRYANELFGSINDFYWTGLYTKVYYANTVLDALPKIASNSSDTQTANNIQGSALFFRANSFYNLVQGYAMPYDAATAASQPGIILRLSSDLNKTYARTSVSACYEQVLNDLKLASDLLPTSNGFPTHPSKTAAFALLARIYLGMNDYENAFKYANLTLQLKSQLTDYNGIDASSSFLFSQDISKYPLAEDIFHDLENGGGAFGYTSSVVSDDLINSYEPTDLRKKCFFSSEYDGFNHYKGSYEFKLFYNYTGLATDEIYLIRAECYARKGNVALAMQDLNTLLIKRFSPPFIPNTATTDDDALKQILKERKKELCFRGIRWLDLRRLNKDPRFAVTLSRTINGITYTLPPNDPRYAAPIPADEVANGIEQNPR